MTYSNTKWVDNPLPILMSSRIRLTGEQRKAVKDAYYTRKNSLQPTQSVGTGGLAVATAYGGSNELDKQLGFSNLVFSDLINSRDSMNLNIVLKLQNVLGVQLITKDEIRSACEKYLDYTFQKAEEE